MNTAIAICATLAFVAASQNELQHFWPSQVQHECGSRLLDTCRSASRQVRTDCDSPRHVPVSPM